MRNSYLALVAVLALTVACTAPDDRSEIGARPGDGLTFAYFGVAETGMIDQTLTIQNSSADAAAPRLAFVALDGEGQPLEQVQVDTVFGSDRGLVVAPADYEVFDILKFDGESADRVKDIDVVVEEAQYLGDDGMAYPELEYLDASGRAVPAPALAATVRIQNPGSQDLVVRLVGIEWNVPAPGRSQQARSVTPVGSPVLAPAHDAVAVQIPANMRGKFDSLKGYISTN